MAGQDPLKLKDVSECGVIHTFNYLVRKKDEYMRELKKTHKTRF